ncbi:hypothetical protein OpiT1DRAFT_01055 [Opitutaceae bacterium TAV1]|nr:hypothetical protein OPIT5_21645 [Opitutaceae bacterium TAV5]EIP96633.1 hypothetical protein OpiT1DRAFT_01055 [Opitutaceae bacterium TAV1]
MTNTRQIPLTGINGASPLGFLAALGAFRVAQHVHTARIGLSWAPAGGTWRPILHAPYDTTPESLVEGLDKYLRAQADSPAFTVAKNIKMPEKAFHHYATQAIEHWFSGNRPNWAAFVAAFGASVPIDENRWTEDSAFRFVRVFKNETDKNGRPEKKPGFLDMVRSIAQNTTRENLHETLFGPWEFRDEEFSLRWDPEDDRRYALRWANPATDKTTVVRGANSLAIEALPLFPTMPTSTQLATTGFVGKKSNDTFWTWPIWNAPIGIDVCQSLLASPELANPSLELATLSPTGVVAVLRSQRINPNDGKFRNFTPAIPVGA